VNGWHLQATVRTPFGLGSSLSHCLSGGGNKGTFKPKKPKNIAKGTKGYDLHKHAKATLGSGNLKAAVQLPPEEDANEWLAVNSEEFTANVEGLLTGFSCRLLQSNQFALWKR
jgi:hypothetical protein